MTRSITRTLATLTLALVSTAVLAQKSAPLDVSIQQVNDRRSSGSFARLTITLELPKIRTSEVAASRVMIASAVDDSGRDLTNSEAAEPDMQTNMRMGLRGSGEDPPATISVELKNPDRKATKLTEVKGQIEMYMPAKDPNSIAEVPKFLSFSGKPLTHRALKANGVEIALISPAQLAAEKKRLGDAKRKEYTDGGYQSETIEQLVSSYLEYTLRMEESDVLFRLKDPNKRIQEITYIDAAGEQKMVSSSNDEGFTKLSTWGGKPQADWKLRVSMKTAKNIVRYPFALADVLLP